MGGYGYGTDSGSQTAAWAVRQHAGLPGLSGLQHSPPQFSLQHPLEHQLQRSLQHQLPLPLAHPLRDSLQQARRVGRDANRTRALSNQTRELSD